MHALMFPFTCTSQKVAVIFRCEESRLQRGWSLEPMTKDCPLGGPVLPTYHSQQARHQGKCATRSLYWASWRVWYPHFRI
jgi:hypothetical protein